MQGSSEIWSLNASTAISSFAGLDSSRHQSYMGGCDVGVMWTRSSITGNAQCKTPWGIKEHLPIYFSKCYRAQLTSPCATTGPSGESCTTCNQNQFSNFCNIEVCVNCNAPNCVMHQTTLPKYDQYFRNANRLLPFDDPPVRYDGRLQRQRSL